MGVSKVVYGNDTLVDLTSDTVTPMSLTLGATAHGADGEPIVGEYQYVLPLMSPDTRGGAKLGNGMYVIGDALTSGAYYTTEMVGTDEVLTLVYEMVEE